MTPPAGVGVCLRLPGQLLVPAELQHVGGPGLPGAPLGQGGPQLVVVIQDLAMDNMMNSKYNIQDFFSPVSYLSQTGPECKLSDICHEELNTGNDHKSFHYKK